MEGLERNCAYLSQMWNASPLQKVEVSVWRGIVGRCREGHCQVRIMCVVVSECLKDVWSKSEVLSLGFD